MRASKIGTIIELPDGRRGTTVYNGLDGIGIKWGEWNVPENEIKGYGGCPDGGEKPPVDYKWYPDAMLREPYPSADLPCVGENFEILGDKI